MHVVIMGVTGTWLNKNKKTDTYLVKPSLEVYNFVAVPLEQSPVIRHLRHMGVVLHFFGSAGKLTQRKTLFSHSRTSCFKSQL